MTTIRRNRQAVQVEWVKKDLWTVSKSTLAKVDHYRTCWICGQSFELGDKVTVAGTKRGNKLLHGRCYAQFDGLAD